MLHGFDDQCGAAKQAGVSGTAQINKDGTVGLAFTVIRPDGLAMPASAIINLATLSGDWLDEWSTRNTFVFNPAAPSGTPRPLLISGSAFIQYRPANPLEPGNALISFGRTLPFVPTLNFVTGAPTANCGSSLEQRPLPGHLCFYVFDSANVGSVTGDVSRSLATVQVVPPNNPARVIWQARWILNVP